MTSKETMEKLTILLACANSESSPLEAVEKERDALIHIFDQVVNQETNGLQYKEEASFEVETLIKAIRTYEKTLHVFHFAGHANGRALKLDDDPAYGEGIARLLARAPKLKLVFLNGCATKGHVAQLMKAGVAAVIATSSKIPDRLAQLFSEYFYQAFISDKRSLLAAFEYAKENIQVLEKNEILDTRDIDDSFTENAVDDIPWGIYFNTRYEQEQVKSWKVEQIFEFNLAPNPDPEFDRNPYIVGPPIKDPDCFFDRSELLANLQNIQQPKVCILGIRRIGKTSLLYQIYHIYQVVNRRIPLMINLQGLKDEAEMGEYLFREIKRASRTNPIVAGFLQIYQTADFIKTLSNWSDFCTDNQLETVLLIDEAEQLRNLSTASLNKFVQLLDVPGGTLSTIITGSRALRELCTDDERFLLNFKQINLDVFPFQDTEALLTQNGTVAVNPQNIVDIAHASGNHPYFTQYIAAQLYDRGRLFSLRSNPDVLILKDDIRQVMADEFKRLSEMEQMVMRLLTFETAINIDALNKKVPLVRAELEAILSELSELSFISFQNNQYKLGNTFWQKYLEIPPQPPTPQPKPTQDPTPLPLNVDPPPPPAPKSTPKSVFISFHLNDVDIYQKLRIHLNPRTLTISDSNSLPLGDDILDSLQAEIDQTQTILLLLSAVYLADDPKFQEREAIKALKARGKKVIPILVSACNWEEEFGSVVILPRSKQPIKAVDDLDQILADIAREIKQLL